MRRIEKKKRALRTSGRLRRVFAASAMSQGRAVLHQQGRRQGPGLRLGQRTLLPLPLPQYLPPSLPLLLAMPLCLTLSLPQQVTLVLSVPLQRALSLPLSLMLPLPPPLLNLPLSRFPFQLSHLLLPAPIDQPFRFFVP